MREADLSAALLRLRAGGLGAEGADWTTLLFQQFHDILPGTSIPEVFDQAEPLWRRSRRQASALRDRQLLALLGDASDSDQWVWCGLQPLARWSPVLRLPRGDWRCEGRQLPTQRGSSGGSWVQLPLQKGVAAVPLQRCRDAKAVSESSEPSLAVRNPVEVSSTSNGGVQFTNGHLTAEFGHCGLVQLWDRAGVPQLRGPLVLHRFRDQGEFWDAWDLAADYRQHSLPVDWQLDGLELVEAGPLLARVLVRARAGESSIRFDCQLRADCPWLELTYSVDWSQVHELLRLELALAEPAVRWAADTSGGVLERPARAHTPGEQMRWEVPVISWFASEIKAPGGGLAVLLDGPQGVDVTPDRMGVSLLRGPTWPDPAADQGMHRQRLALMPVPAGWSRAGVPQAALSFREPGWCRPAYLDRSLEWLPPLPPELVPVACSSASNDSLAAQAAGSISLRVLNPGARRQCWRAEGWAIRRLDPTPEGLVLCEPSSGGITLRPGELATLELRRL